MIWIKQKPQDILFVKASKGPYGNTEIKPLPCPEETWAPLHVPLASISCRCYTFLWELMQFVSILQHCTLDFGSYTKDLTIVNEDLSSVFILDNSPGAYQYNPGKAGGT